MQVANGRVVVPAPAFTPSQYGLFSVAEDVTAEFEGTQGVGQHWAAGIIWQPLCPAGATTYDECITTDGDSPPPAPPAKSATFSNVRQGATPFSVFFRKDCSIPTYWDEAAGEVREALTVAESFEVEQAFWTGVTGAQKIVFPHLAADAEVVVDRDTLQLEADEVTATAVDIVQGFGMLEAAAMACLRGQVTLHVPVDAASALVAWDLIRLDGARYVTALGNLVAIGAGYTGSAPDGTDATPASTWLYATGPVFYARGPLQEFAPDFSVALSVNTLEQMAERTYVVGYSCCLLAAEIDLTITIGPA